ncbi:nucleoid-associated protein [Cellulophaga sp. BC115SP]|uniref:nucleoid-associated protein n=1 Tax=Cellulophaga sp. BC115SP TaxID=2683263 RepID=UPI001412BF75|nr:nucleoid-associated protein [Cellulophaga sp. BC115SP]NBB31984.1 nucleoid-associated protein [Cellulophaga sp. BC115SP]
MNKFNISDISGVAVHHVGVKYEEEGILISRSLLNLTPSLKETLLKYFVSSFKSDEYFSFTHSVDLNLNEVYTFVSEIFQNSLNLHENSIKLVKHLYQCSEHPNIKSGEFYTVHFPECFFEGYQTEAIGLFKSESRETYIDVIADRDALKVESYEGFNINKIDRGCLIFNIPDDQGFVIALCNGTKKEDSVYWNEDFLGIIPRKDNYHNTQNVLSLYKSFITNNLPTNANISSAEKAVLLNKSLQYFKDNDHFNLEEFNHKVLESSELIDQFHEFKDNNIHKFNFSEEFLISEKALVKQKRAYKKVLKLDRNFEIHISGNQDLFEKGVDSDGRKYYKFYYNQEL